MEQMNAQNVNGVNDIKEVAIYLRKSRDESNGSEDVLATGEWTKRSSMIAPISKNVRYSLHERRSLT
jgi:hypothetical protein